MDLELYLLIEKRKNESDSMFEKWTEKLKRAQKIRKDRKARKRRMEIMNNLHKEVNYER